MNANRRRANLRMDQLRRRLRAEPHNPHVAQWRLYVRADRESRELLPLGAHSWMIRANLRNRDGSHPTDAYVRDHTRRILAAIRTRQPLPIL
jgi:hypothetical protein